MYLTTQRELAPEEDQGILFNIVKTPQTANLDYLEQATAQLDKVFETVPEKEHVFTVNGSAATCTRLRGHAVQAVERARAHTEADAGRTAAASLPVSPVPRCSRFRCPRCRARSVARPCSS